MILATIIPRSLTPSVVKRHQLCQNVGGPLTLSALGNIRKVKEGVVKDRIISDLREANKLPSRNERVVLPRPIDHAMAVSRSLARQHGTWLLVLDFADAYNAIPLLPEERHFVIAFGLVCWRAGFRSCSFQPGDVPSGHSR
eukprot:5812521-Amphidinium_carterae.1